jgi:hypothetical protein
LNLDGSRQSMSHSLPPSRSASPQTLRRYTPAITISNTHQVNKLSPSKSPPRNQYHEGFTANDNRLCSNSLADASSSASLRFGNTYNSTAEEEVKRNSSSSLRNSTINKNLPLDQDILSYSQSKSGPSSSKTNSRSTSPTFAQSKVQSNPQQSGLVIPHPHGQSSHSSYHDHHVPKQSHLLANTYHAPVSTSTSPSRANRATVNPRDKPDDRLIEELILELRELKQFPRSQPGSRYTSPARLPSSVHSASFPDVKSASGPNRSASPDRAFRGSSHKINNNLSSIRRQSPPRNQPHMFDEPTPKDNPPLPTEEYDEDEHYFEPSTVADNAQVGTHRLESAFSAAKYLIKSLNHLQNNGSLHPNEKEGLVAVILFFLYISKLELNSLM